MFTRVFDGGPLAIHQLIVYGIVVCVLLAAAALINLKEN